MTWHVHRSLCNQLSFSCIVSLSWLFLHFSVGWRGIYIFFPSSHSFWSQIHQDWQHSILLSQHHAESTWIHEALMIFLHSTNPGHTWSSTRHLWICSDEQSKLEVTILPEMRIPPGDGVQLINPASGYEVMVIWNCGLCCRTVQGQMGQERSTSSGPSPISEFTFPPEHLRGVGGVRREQDVFKISEGCLSLSKQNAPW